VVKIFATVRYPNPYQPWTKDSPEDQTGSGVVIEGRRILTNAHVVDYASQVQIQAIRPGIKYPPRWKPSLRESIWPCSSWMMKNFSTRIRRWHGPNIAGHQGHGLTYGFPEGGNSLSITKGIVSRVEFTPYNFRFPVCASRLIAAINPGNSGGPAAVGRQDDRSDVQPPE